MNLEKWLDIPTGNDILSKKALRNNIRKTFITRLFKSFEFGNGSRISDKNLVMLEFKHLQNREW